MKQIDILLRQRPSDYVIQVGDRKSYEIVLPSRTHTSDIVVDGLLDRQGIYGDELQPLIFHLVQNETECLLYVDLLVGTFLYTYDGKLLRELDDYTLESMDNISSYNSFALQQSNVSLSSAAVLQMNEDTMRLISQAKTTLQQYIAAQSSPFKLKHDITLTDLSIVAPQDLHASLLVDIVNNLVNQVFVELGERGVHWLDGLLKDYDDMLLCEIDNYVPKMSLIQNHADVYMQFAIDLKKLNFKLASQIDDFISNITLDAGRNTMSLTSDKVALDDYTYFYPGAFNISIENNSADMIIRIVCESGYFVSSLSDSITRNMGLTESLSCNESTSMRTSLLEDLELMSGLEFYDDDLLMTWDSWTLEDMAEAARIA